MNQEVPRGFCRGQEKLLKKLVYTDFYAQCPKAWLMEPSVLVGSSVTFCLSPYHGRMDVACWTLYCDVFLSCMKGIYHVWKGNCTHLN